MWYIWRGVYQVARLDFEVFLVSNLHDAFSRKDKEEFFRMMAMQRDLPDAVGFKYEIKWTDEFIRPHQPVFQSDFRHPCFFLFS